MLAGPDLLVILAIALIVFGPKKLPELAKSIGLAKKEFEKAAKEVTASTTTGTSETSPDPLVTAAKNLGIVTEGKTKEEIAREIADRTAKK